jgi:type VI secretion system protein VasG
MTSNAGTDAIAKLCADPETMPDAEGLAAALRPDLLKVFKPAFLGRVTMVPYFPLSDEVLREIVRLQLERIRRRVAENYKVQCSYDPALIEQVAERCKEAESGARNIESILSRGLLAELSAQILARLADGGTIEKVEIGISRDGGFQYQLTGEDKWVSIGDGAAKTERAHA